MRLFETKSHLLFASDYLCDIAIVHSQADNRAQPPTRAAIIPVAEINEHEICESRVGYLWIIEIQRNGLRQCWYCSVSFCGIGWAVRYESDGKKTTEKKCSRRLELPSLVRFWRWVRSFLSPELTEAWQWSTDVTSMSFSPFQALVRLVFRMYVLSLSFLQRSRMVWVHSGILSLPVCLREERYLEYFESSLSLIRLEYVFFNRHFSGFSCNFLWKISHKRSVMSPCHVNLSSDTNYAINTKPFFRLLWKCNFWMPHNTNLTSWHSVQMSICPRSIMWR